MATIKFILQSKKNPANIYIRLSFDRQKVLKRKSGFIVNPLDWSYKRGMPKPGDVDRENLQIKLEKMASSVKDRINVAMSSKAEITSDWLQDQINLINGITKDDDISKLTNYIQSYIDELPFKDYGRKKKAAKATVQKYTTLKNKIIAFQKHKRKSYTIKDVNSSFRNQLLKYFIDVDMLAANTAGGYIHLLKTVCLDAQKKGIEVSSQLSDMKGFTEKTSKIFLSFGELELIKDTKYTRPALENAKDWLIIGCYIGQRVSDLLKITSSNINVRNGLKLIELTQKKTGKRVSIPFHPEVDEILSKRKGQFPEKISDQRFNEYLKDICKLAKISSPTVGSKLINIGTDEAPKWRKKTSVYPKWELITSHVCRRSFASNFYGEIPTALLISITAHSTEQQFLEYIGKNSNDYAIQIADYWTKQQLKANDQAPMTVLKQAR